ncbi:MULTISPECIES: deoxyribonuclease IV [Fervidobacterium]|uniref:Probable endonuclease 4 n=1 Tax=Fervidobacterium nodosum (strain ATCC 35602 / DSM 5306 / Rt17-B1) TaxID=381764 RepID=A7HLL4_FERNB|nr:MULTISPECIES: deoxyribonuclease IV [Fervidobacterium]ABS60797.1 apurinic endonuclease Apn1 [Fervidobacterium nodosum Rt17-B1]
MSKKDKELIIGAHMPIGGGFARVPRETIEIGGNAFQIFPHNPRQWNAKLPNEDDVVHFLRDVKKYNLNPEYFLCHSGYLVNVASPRDDVWEKSVELLAIEMKICAKLGIKYLNIHPGSHLGEGEEVGIERIVKALNLVMEKEKSVHIMLENVVMKGGNIGYNFSQMRRIIEQCKYPERIGLTFDTCHGYDAGYDVTKPEGIKKLLEEIDREVGIGRIKFVHLNDTKNTLGSNKDRHENIGNGNLGVEGLKVFLSNPVFSSLPLLLETPGDNPEHAEDIAKIKEIYDSIEAPN